MAKTTAEKAAEKAAAEQSNSGDQNTGAGAPPAATVAPAPEKPQDEKDAIGYREYIRREREAKVKRDELARETEEKELLAGASGENESEPGE